jgi:hypothetical protein
VPRTVSFVTGTSDAGALDRFGWVIGAAVATLVVREIYEVWRDRRDRRERDRLILTALAREVIIIKGVAAAIVKDMNREREMLNRQGAWRTKPLMALPTMIYEMVRDRIPTALLEEEDGFVQLIGLQTQCAFMNQLATEQQAWKAPAAGSHPNQLAVIMGFHAEGVFDEAINAVFERCNRLLVTLERAGDEVGGLALKRIEPDATNQE